MLHKLTIRGQEMWDFPSLAHCSVEPAKSGCWCKDFSPWIHRVKWCEVRREPEFVPVESLPVCSRIQVCLLKCREHRVLQKEVLFQSNVTNTSDRGCNIGGFSTLTKEFTRTCLFHSRSSVGGLLELDVSLKPLATVVFQILRCVTPATAIHAKLQLRDDGSNH